MPEYDKSYYPSYSAIVDAFEYEVIDSKMCGSYQGDYYFLLHNNGEYCVLVIGYGSCSGCDALEAAMYDGMDLDDDDDKFSSKRYWSRGVIALADSLYESIRWESKEETLKTLTHEEKDNTDWYYFDSEAKELFDKWKELLSER